VVRDNHFYIAFLQMPRFLRRRVPVVMPAIDKGDGHLGQFGHRGIVEAVHADADKRAAAGRIAAAKRAHAAVAAKVMAFATGAKAVFAQVRFSCQQVECCGRHLAGPAADFQAIGTVAAQAGGGQVNLGREAHAAAVATAMVDFFHRGPLYTDAVLSCNCWHGDCAASIRARTIMAPVQERGIAAWK
jgi:hypothetical protein